MRRSTVALLVATVAFYIAFLFFLRSLIPENITPSVALLALPLIILAFIVITNLSSQAVQPSGQRFTPKSQRIRARDVQVLSKQIEVGTKASAAYFDQVILTRLRDLLAEKICSVTGVEKESTKLALSDPKTGPRLIKDLELYRLLYYPPSPRPQDRLPTIRRIIDQIEGWKP